MSSLSGSDNISGGGHSFITFKWYVKLFTDQKFSKGGLNSLIVGITSSIICTILSFYLAILWKDSKNKIYIVFLTILLAVIPSDVHAFGIKCIFKYILGYRTSSMASLIFSHFSSILPYCFILIIASLSQISTQLLKTSYDLGGSKLFTIRKIVFPLLAPAIISSLSLGFLLSFNEYSRTTYLSGSTPMLSELIYGEMASGTDPSINALGGINVIMAIIVVMLITISYAMVKKKIIKY